MEGRAGNSLVEGPGKPSTDEDLGQDNQGTLSLDKMVRQWQWALAPAPIWTGCPLQLMHNYYHHLPRGPLCLSLLFSVLLAFLVLVEHILSCLPGKGYMEGKLFGDLTCPRSWTIHLIDGFSYRLEETFPQNFGILSPLFSFTQQIFIENLTHAWQCSKHLGYICEQQRLRYRETESKGLYSR